MSQYTENSYSNPPDGMRSPYRFPGGTDQLSLDDLQFQLDFHDAGGSSYPLPVANASYDYGAGTYPPAAADFQDNYASNANYGIFNQYPVAPYVAQCRVFSPDFDINGVPFPSNQTVGTGPAFGGPAFGRPAFDASAFDAPGQDYSNLSFDDEGLPFFPSLPNLELPVDPRLGSSSISRDGLPQLPTLQQFVQGPDEQEYVSSPESYSPVYKQDGVLNSSETPETPETPIESPDQETLETPVEEPEQRNPEMPGEKPKQQTPAPIQRSGILSKKVPIKSTGLYFDNYDEAMHASNKTFFKSPLPDPTIPVAAEDKQNSVKALVSAIRNNGGCKEKVTSRTFHNRWSDRAQFYIGHEIEALAWKIVEAMIDIHTNGWTTPIYDHMLLKQIETEKHYTFKKRFDTLVDLLMYSKRTCEDLLKGDKLYSVIGAPHVLASRTNSNTRSNQRKADRIRRAVAMEQADAAALGVAYPRPKAPKSTTTKPDMVDDGAPKRGNKRARAEDDGDDVPATPVHRAKRVRAIKAPKASAQV